MADKYSTIQQYQPFRVPSGWDKQERQFILQLEETLDDIYRRFGRLRFEDMGEKFQNRLESDEGNISELTIDITGISTRVSTAEGNISTLQQTATGLTTRVSNAEGNISTLQQTATGLTTRVSTAEGNISTLQQTASGLTTRVGTAEGNISTLQQTATSLSVAVENKYSVRSGVDITPEGVEISGSKYIKIKSGNTVNILLDQNGIDMQTAGKVFIHAKDGTQSSIIFGTNEANATFMVGLSGDVKATSVTTNSLSVAGRLLPGIVVSETQPSGSNIVWIKPSSSTDKQWSKTPENYNLNSSGGTLGYYRDYTVPYAAADYLSGNLFYGIKVRLYYFANSWQNVSLKARLQNGSNWIDLGTTTQYVGQGSTITVDGYISAATTNIMNVSGGNFTVRVEANLPSGQCRLVIEDFILKAKTVNGGGGFAACSVFYKS